LINFIKGLEKDGKEYNGGVDPQMKSYKCYITLENNNKLKVRGYLGMAILTHAILVSVHNGKNLFI
jgi:uncharacterized protein (DUF2147 family)